MVKKTIWDGADSYWDLDCLGVKPWADVPTGITVHSTADNNIDRVKKSMHQDHLGYHFLIDRSGFICQTASLGKCVNHAGIAAWNSQSPNRNHVAIALISWGLLTDGKSWTGVPVPGFVTTDDGQQWDPATRSQESSLLRLIGAMMEEFQISPANICGHDECCIPIGRKSDPGGILSRPLSAIRKELSQ